MQHTARPLVRVKPKDLVQAGVERVGRVTGVRDGLPLLDDGRVLDAANVIWCTGYKGDFSWIDLPVFDEKGLPRHRRGIVADEPGLYFMGLEFQYSLSLGRDHRRRSRRRLRRKAHRRQSADGSGQRIGSGVRLVACCAASGSATPRCAGYGAGP
jgi:hypothetical protein